MGHPLRGPPTWPIRGRAVEAHRASARGAPDQRRRRSRADRGHQQSNAIDTDTPLDETAWPAQSSETRQTPRTPPTTRSNRRGGDGRRSATRRGSSRGSIDAGPHLPRSAAMRPPASDGHLSRDRGLGRLPSAGGEAEGRRRARERHVALAITGAAARQGLGCREQGRAAATRRAGRGRAHCPCPPGRSSRRARA
jgi:hypothetical protein